MRGGIGDHEVGSTREVRHAPSVDSDCAHDDVHGRNVSRAPRSGRVIFDKTGLRGYYAFTLENDGFDPNGLSIFTSLQEQLGLKLESGKGPVDVLVIDHIERPTPD